MSNHTKSATPAKPHPDFPLFPHGNGQWAKKVRGKLYFFGVWRDADAALTLWNKQKDYLLEGRRPPANLDGATLKDLANRFLTAKQRLVDIGELSHRSFVDYFATCDAVLSFLGKNRLLLDIHPEDFEKLREHLAKGRGPISLGNNVSRVRSLFKYAFENRLIDRPVLFGSEFKKPSRKAIRQHRAKRGVMMFEPEEIHKLLKAASPHLKAMILLGTNAGLGNSDIGNLPLSALDLTTGWLNFPRPKTGVDRRIPLWSETIKAIHESLEHRPEPKEPGAKELAFVTKRGQSWFRVKPGNPLSQEFKKLLDETGLYRPGRNFYALRHVAETIGGESRDQVAVNAIMGHVDATMAGHYRERISDERLRAVTEHVRQWLFGVTKRRPK